MKRQVVKRCRNFRINLENCLKIWNIAENSRKIIKSSKEIRMIGKLSKKIWKSTKSMKIFKGWKYCSKKKTKGKLRKIVEYLKIS